MNLTNFALAAHRPIGFRQFAQESSILGGIQMEGIIQTIIRQMGKFILLSSHKFQAIVAIRLVMAASQTAHPEMVKGACPMVFAGAAKGMKISMVFLGPILEIDAEFEGAFSLFHKVNFGDADNIIVTLQRRNRCLTHANCADLFRFNQRQINRLTKGFRQGSSSHPARCATAGNHHFFSGFHFFSHFPHLFKQRNTNILIFSAVSGVNSPSTPRPIGGICSTAFSASLNT